MLTPSRRQQTSLAWDDPAALLAERTAHVQDIVCSAFREHLSPVAPEGVALLAVGGFGRCELFRHSDIDLLILSERQSLGERQRAGLSAFLQSLWDRGLRASHSVHTRAECCELYNDNLELTISLLDERFLAGDRGLHARLSLELAPFIHRERQALARLLCRSARARHAKYGGTIHQLEPDVKSSPGGLRDYQLSRWLARLRSSSTDPDGGEAGRELGAARDFLFSVRCRLHELAGRDSNALTFDLQDQLAEECAAAPAEWMREYFGRARAVHRSAIRHIEAAEEQSSSLLAQFQDWRSRLANAEFSVSRERVYFRAPARLPHDPALALRLFQFVSRHGFRLAAETERRLQECVPGLRAAFAEPAAPLWPEFKPILALPHRELALRSMHETGMLGALLPEWQAIDCLVVRDFYHRYTVDEHTLVALRALDDLRTSREPGRRNFSELAAEAGNADALGLAVLFHDLGKASPDGQHVAASVRLARTALARLGVPGELEAMVLRLIEHHLDLSAATTTRDLDDPATARRLASCAGTVETLKSLMLLTYADISAVNPAAMTAWRLAQLWRAYVSAYNELTRELEDARVAPAQAVAEFVEGFPQRYLRTHSDAEIAAHAALDRRSRERGVAVDLVHENGSYRVTVVARDRPALLASIAGTLAAFGMNILKAEGFANRHGTILDTFVFADPHRTLELNPPEADRLRVMLERVVLGRADVKTLLQGRPRPAAPTRRSRIDPIVSFSDTASDSATLVEVVAQDRPGLLYELAAALASAGCNIDVVLIDTEAHKAIDVFYVTVGGRKLARGEQERAAKLLAGVCSEGKA